MIKIIKMNTCKIDEYLNSISIEKLVSEYKLSSNLIFFNNKFRIKICERENDFIAFTNVGIYNFLDGSIDGICGLGSTAEEALENSINSNVELILRYEEIFQRKLIESDYVYIDFDQF